MELAVLNKEGKETGKKVTLDAGIFGIEPNDHAIYLDVKQYLANQRQGTHKAKERNEVKGSTRKVKRQKGTGTARFGDIKNPLFRGGGRIFGPRPRDYRFKLNKKVKRLARLSAFTYKAQQEKIKIVEDFNLETPKTKEYANMLNNLGVFGTKTILVVPEANKNIYLSARNIPDTEVKRVSDLSTYDIMRAGSLLFTEEAINALQNAKVEA